jgi:hypothetical protein
MRVPGAGGVAGLSKMRTCASCGEQSLEQKLCARCKQVSYCSKACQTRDWKEGGHKQRCGTSQD